MELDNNMIIQYTIVGIIILIALIWLAVKVIRKSKGKDKGACCGCALSEKCMEKGKPQKRSQSSAQKKDCCNK